jgi:hypothetical protein
MHIARIDVVRNAYKVLVGMLEGKKPRRRGSEWKDNIKIENGFLG